MNKATTTTSLDGRRPCFVASNCESWATKMMHCGGKAYADAVGFSRDVLGYRCVPQSVASEGRRLQFYDFTFRQTWLVIPRDKLPWAKRFANPWLGIILWSGEGSCELLRDADYSPLRRSIAIADLLWTSEVKELLELCCDEMPLSGRQRMREQLAEALSPEHLGPLASLIIVARQRWRAIAA